MALYVDFPLTTVNSDIVVVLPYSSLKETTKSILPTEKIFYEAMKQKYCSFQASRTYHHFLEAVYVQNVH